MLRAQLTEYECASFYSPHNSSVDICIPVKRISALVEKLVSLTVNAWTCSILLWPHRKLQLPAQCFPNHSPPLFIVEE